MHCLTGALAYTSMHKSGSARTHPPQHGAWAVSRKEAMVSAHGSSEVIQPLISTVAPWRTAASSVRTVAQLTSMSLTARPSACCPVAAHPDPAIAFPTIVSLDPVIPGRGCRGHDFYNRFRSRGTRRLDDARGQCGSTGDHTAIQGKRCF